jgi:putative Holliday junction resolvase
VKPSRILAVDYGRKRIGLALSDELGLTAQPLTTLLRTNRRDNFRRLREICMDKGITRIIVGHPLLMNGDEGEMADEAGRFAGRLRKETGIEVELLDERLTSWEARQIMTETQPARPVKQNRPIDDVAAALLLREYLARSSQSTKEKE